MHRRSFLRLLACGGSSLATGAASHFLLGCQDAAEGVAEGVQATEQALPFGAGESPYGHWTEHFGAPAFVYDADHESLPFAEWDPISAPRTRRHWLMMGNRAVRIQAANDGGIALFDEAYGLRWLVAPEPSGSGVSVIDDGTKRWSTFYAERAGTDPSRRTFGPTWFQVRDADDGLAIERTVLCREGEVPWLLVRVRISRPRRAHDTAEKRVVRHIERWTLRPRFLQVRQTAEQARTRAALAVRYDAIASSRGVVAMEVFADPNGTGPEAEAAKFLFGPPATIGLECLGDTQGTAQHRIDPGEAHPTLEIETSLELAPGETRELWFRFGRADGTAVAKPERLFERSLEALRARLPRATSLHGREAAREIPWHAAMLTGGLAADRAIGGHTLNQDSAYSYLLGFNGAARDPLQHALPLVYIEPEMALSVLRNTCAWAKPDGDLPYALNGNKRPTNLLWRPSDLNLWALWLAAEYAAATGDHAAFDRPLAYHPVHGTPDVPLREHLRRQFRFFVDVVGRGEGRHVRILNADWNDVALDIPGVDRQQMIERGSSVLNSAFASWVLSIFGGLAERLGETALAKEARDHADDLRGLVRTAYNGRWFHRAYAPGGQAIGDANCWLEGQPWAILCGAADPSQARTLLDVVDAGHRSDSPLGARVKWPNGGEPGWGQGTQGGIWYSINMTFIWAASRIDRALAWDEWRRMSLRSHTASYPDIWEGTLSGPDAWNAPEYTRPGRTWASPTLGSMQAYPVNNMHSHAQPLLAYLRLLGVEPTPRGSLQMGGRGGDFRSEVFRLRFDGHGSIDARGTMALETAHGPVEGGRGTVRW